ADGPKAYTVIVAPATSADGDYNGVDGADVAVVNVDNDTAGVTVSATYPVITYEARPEVQPTFTVVLNARPAMAVTIPVSSDDPEEGTVSPTSLTFTPSNWNAPQVVTLTGADDHVADGNQVYHAVLGPATSADPAYAGVDGMDVVVSNVDDDSP